jgi:hypothetical protein
VGRGEAVGGLQGQHAAQQGQGPRVVHQRTQRLRAARRRGRVEASGGEAGAAVGVGDEGDGVGRVRVGGGGREHLEGNLLLQPGLDALQVHVLKRTVREQRFANQQLREHAACAPHVRWVRPTALEQGFGGPIFERAQSRRVILPIVNRTAEIDEGDNTICLDKNVFGFDVRVNDTLAVHIMQRWRKLLHYVKDFIPR